MSKHYDKAEGLCDSVDIETQSYVFNQTMLRIKDPEKYRLPALGPQPTYLIAKNDSYFVYPNDASKYQEKFKNTFQHGGVSMEELIIPIVLMRSKK